MFPKGKVICVCTLCGKQKFFHEGVWYSGQLQSVATRTRHADRDQRRSEAQRQSEEIIPEQQESSSKRKRLISPVGRSQGPNLKGKATRNY